MVTVEDGQSRAQVGAACPRFRLSRTHGPADTAEKNRAGSVSCLRSVEHVAPSMALSKVPGGIGEARGAPQKGGGTCLGTCHHGGGITQRTVCCDSQLSSRSTNKCSQYFENWSSVGLPPPPSYR